MRITGDIDDNGQANTDLNEILIRKQITQSQKEATLLHEAMHFCNTTIKHDLLDSLAEQLYQILSDNKLLK